MVSRCEYGQQPGLRCSHPEFVNHNYEFNCGKCLPQSHHVLQNQPSVVVRPNKTPSGPTSSRHLSTSSCSSTSSLNSDMSAPSSPMSLHSIENNKVATTSSPSSTKIPRAAYTRAYSSSAILTRSKMGNTPVQSPSSSSSPASPSSTSGRHHHRSRSAAVYRS